MESREPEVRQFSGGASNLTYLLRYRERDLILRRAPMGTKAKGAHDMHREYTIQSKLAPVLPYVAPMIGFCDDAGVIGSDFYVMGRIDGVIPRSEWPADGELAPRVSTAEQSNTSVIFGQHFILKVFRVIDWGLNPEYEIGRYLAERGFAATARLEGALEYRQSAGAPA